MSGIRVLVALLVMAAVGACGRPVVAADALPGENIIDVKIALPKGDTYLRGATDPVQDLVVELTLANKTQKEDLNKESIAVTRVQRLSSEEVAQLQSDAAANNLKLEDALARVDKKRTDDNIEQYKINKESLGYAYTEPRLGPHDDIDFIITKVPEDGEAPPPENAKPKIIRRDNKPNGVLYTDVAPALYLAAGETSPTFTLPIGKFYLISEPGTYTIKAVMRLIGDNSKGGKYAESNEERFSVLPFKVVPAKIEEVRENIEEYERGFPKFDYMLYQVKTSGPFDEIWYAQRIPVRGVDNYEWMRVCTVKPGTAVQVKQLASKRVALLAVHAKGDAGLYTLDFTRPGAKVAVKTMAVKDTVPKLKVENGKASVE